MNVSELRAEARNYPRGRTADYCGYCGQDFKRRARDPDSVCRACLNGPERDAILRDIDYDRADRANERDLAERARRGK